MELLSIKVGFLTVVLQPAWPSTSCDVQWHLHPYLQVGLRVLWQRPVVYHYHLPCVCDSLVPGIQQSLDLELNICQLQWQPLWSASCFGSQEQYKSQILVAWPNHTWVSYNTSTQVHLSQVVIVNQPLSHLLQSKSKIGQLLFPYA